MKRNLKLFNYNNLFLLSFQFITVQYFGTQRAKFNNWIKI